MLLKKLINNIPEEKKKIKIRGLSINSKQNNKGFIFFAIKGHRSNGEKFIGEAVKNGASAIVCSKTCKYKSETIPVVSTSNVRETLSIVASKFYKLKPKNIIAVTGTNGKTSVADFFYQILSNNNVPVASVGTLGIKFKGKTYNSSLTSPDTIALHKILEKLKKNNIDNVIIEASSHGLKQKRMDHLNLKSGIFTNFSQDHLDYHKTMKAYLNAKLILFNNLLSKKKTIISDSSIKQYQILKKISKRRKLNLIDSKPIEERIENKKNLKLIKFQRKNLSMAISAAKLCKLSDKMIYSSLSKIKGIDGRLELVRTFSNKINVFVDYAHTPDALYKSLNSLKDIFGNKISIVFGCGGDRDVKKRPIMAKIADTFCKKIYVTDDNPRNEKPDKIRKEIIKNIKHNNFFNIGNRAKAIKTSISNAEPGEVILVAGKGHEIKQIYRNKTLLISDKKIIKKLKLNIKRVSIKKQNFLQNKKIIKDMGNNFKLDNFHGISIDTRILKKNNLFLTLKGNKNDGNKFIPQALKKGAKYIISTKSNKNFRKKIIKVDNEIEFLNNFAIKKRDFSQAKIIAITGSAGKTSLKNLISNLLKNYGNTLSSPKSYNNYLGVPISLSQLKISHQFGVFEVGMSKKGEINALTKIIRPQIGIITNIGEAHIENFENLESIANAKGEMLNNIKKGGTIILNRDDKFFNHLNKKAKLKNLKVISFGKNKSSDVYPVSIIKSGKKTIVNVKIINELLKFEISNVNIYNFLSSLALLKVLNLNVKKIIKSFKKYTPIEGRGRIYDIRRYKKNFKLIDESYNANPLSMKNAINNFNSIKKNKSKKYLLLGDMLELGKKSEILHKNISKVINSSDIDKVFIKGNKTLITYMNIYKEKRGNIFQQDEDVDFTLKSIIANNDYLMIKGSNATGLNDLSKKMIKGY
ncbi:MAG: UDP-N-acetylmuramoyl-L-alanyl-D-glutamate--2,6-diaminopimelate ligase [Pseudomonadota bacterium]|nr:UDP-N-acetylmuramoyl-L-alanyl-D-glutamate--2,6-diaminopimelate ligase [Pseudomonadota bacterium]